MSQMFVTSGEKKAEKRGKKRNNKKLVGKEAKSKGLKNPDKHLKMFAHSSSHKASEHF